MAVTDRKAVADQVVAAPVWTFSVVTPLHRISDQRRKIMSNLSTTFAGEAHEIPRGSSDAECDERNIGAPVERVFTTTAANFLLGAH